MNSPLQRRIDDATARVTAAEKNLEKAMASIQIQVSPRADNLMISAEIQAALAEWTAAKKELQEAKRERDLK